MGIHCADPSLAVGIPPRVVDESAKATRVLRCVDAPTLPVIFEVVDIRALQKKNKHTCKWAKE